MTGNDFLLDTSVIIEVLVGNKLIADKVNSISNFYISSVVLGELYIGIFRVSNRAKHLKKLEQFLSSCTVLDTDYHTAMQYGEQMALLYKKGKPIPTNDVWIAFVAIQHNLTLITGDKHFSEIANLNSEIW